MWKLKTTICRKGIHNSILKSRIFFSSSKIDFEPSFSQKKEYFDIVVAGGGMVGNAMVSILSQDNIFKNLKIALIDTSSDRNNFKNSEIHQNQVCALNAASIDLLKSTDSWDFIQQNRFGEVHSMHVWDGSSDAFISFNRENEQNLAWIIENELILASLKRNLSKYKNIKVFYSNEIKDFTQSDQTIDIELKNNQNITAKLLIGSDGSDSLIRKKANIDTIKWNYDQIAIVSTMKLSNRTQNFTAWQRFLSTGPIALLPLNDEFSCLVWSIKKNLAKNLLELNDEEFVQKVNQAFIGEDFKNELGSTIENLFQNGIDFLKNAIPRGDSFFTSSDKLARMLPPKVISSGPKLSFPLSFIHSNNYVSKRLALIGDSIHKIHPLAGQGVNMGFGDVICLKECLKDSILSGNEIGSWSFLKDYESKRQKQAISKMIGIDFLNKLYTDSNYNNFLKTPIVAARTIGLTFSNRVIPIKNFLMNQAIK